MLNCEQKFVLYSPHTIFSTKYISMITVNKAIRILFAVVSSSTMRTCIMFSKDAGKDADGKIDTEYK